MSPRKSCILLAKDWMKCFQRKILSNIWVSLLCWREDARHQKALLFKHQIFNNLSLAATGSHSICPTPTLKALRLGAVQPTPAGDATASPACQSTHRFRATASLTHQAPTASGIWYPLISFRVYEYTRDIPDIYQCFERYQGYLW